MFNKTTPAAVYRLLAFWKIILFFFFPVARTWQEMVDIDTLAYKITKNVGSENLHPHLLISIQRSTNAGESDRTIQNVATKP